MRQMMKIGVLMRRAVLLVMSACATKDWVRESSRSRRSRDQRS